MVPEHDRSPFTSSSFWVMHHVSPLQGIKCNCPPSFTGLLSQASSSPHTKTPSVCVSVNNQLSFILGPAFHAGFPEPSPKFPLLIWTISRISAYLRAATSSWTATLGFHFLPFVGFGTAHLTTTYLILDNNSCTLTLIHLISSVKLRTSSKYSFSIQCHTA